MEERDAPSVVIDPAAHDAVVFDMDGVVTDTAGTHEAAWKRLFDELLTAAAPEGADRRPFTSDDYRRFVDGRSRLDGVTTFLASRGISLPEGQPGDAPGCTTAWALANRKNRYLLDELARNGVAVFPSSVELARAARQAGLRTAIVTASRNRAAVLGAAGVADLFDAHVDGVDAAALGLAGKPDPALFLEAARRLGVHPTRAVVIEDALAGVEAGRRGGFGLVIGVARHGEHDDLLAAGADVAVADLAEVQVCPRATR